MVRLVTSLLSKSRDNLFLQKNELQLLRDYSLGGVVQRKPGYHTGALVVVRVLRTFTVRNRFTKPVGGHLCLVQRTATY